MEEFFTSRSGFPTAKKGHISLHSAYDPVKEAERFLESRICDPPSLVILIGSGLGYLDKVILAKYPNCRVLSLHSTSLYIQKGGLSDFLSLRYQLWMPESATTLARFLSMHISEMDLEGLEVLIWPSMVQADPACQNLVQQVTAFIKQLQGSFFSLSHFGWRWLNNTLRNFADWQEQVVLPKPENIVIAASGPSLQQAIPLLQASRDQLFLLALPSSLAALQHYGLRPDLVVMTDGGYYATQHLQFLSGDVPIAMPLVAGCVSQHPRFIFTFNSEFEHVLMQGLDVLSLPWNGTVAANAIMLAMSMTQGKIILAGQDFCGQALHLHAEPHTFTPIYYAQSSRLLPFVDFYQKTMWNSQASLTTYAQWFQSHSWPANIYRLCPSQVDLPFPTMSRQEFKKITGTKQTASYQAHPLRLTQQERLNRIGHLVTQFEHQFQQERSDPSEGDMWLYLDALDLYQYKKAKRLNQGVTQARDRLCDKVAQRIKRLQEHWLG